MTEIAVKRIYDPFAANDGKRVLVDRVWPRGISKSQANLDLWLKDIAPSAELREWFGHVPDRWSEFRERYFMELHGLTALIGQVEALASEGRVTLLFSARDTSHNNAVALLEYLSLRRVCEIELSSDLQHRRD